MPTHLEIRNAISATLTGVAGIGTVQSYERFARKQADLSNLYVSDGQLRGWLIRRLRRPATFTAVGRRTIDTGWQLRGYMSLDDSAASELAFDDLIDAAIDAFIADADLGGTVATTNVGDKIGLQLDQSGPVMFAGVLCHEARLTLTSRHYE